MLLLSALFTFHIVLTCAAPWEGVAREEPSNYGNGAWYQMPQPASYPTSAYDRAAQNNPSVGGYAGYPRPYSRSPDYYPDSSVSNNMVPPIGARKSPAIGYGYPNAASAAAAGAMMSTQDRLRLTAIERYLPLLRKKAVTTTPKPTPKPRRRTRPAPRFASTTPKSPSVDSVMRTLKPKVNTKAKPFIESWKCAKKPCKRPRPRPRHRVKTTTTTTTAVPEVITRASRNRDRVPRPRPRGERRPHRVVRTKATTTTTTAGPDFSSGEESESIVRLRTARPYTFAPRYKLSRHRVNSTSGSTTTVSTTTVTTTTTAPTTVPSTMASVAFNVSATPKFTPKSTTKAEIKSTSTPQVTIVDPKRPKSLKPRKTTAESTSTAITTSTTPRPKIVIPLPEEPSELVLVPTFKGTQPLRITPSTEAPSLPEFPFNLFAPNAELIAAIKDVVKKFKQSLDRTGVQDDVRQMGSQLETTWNDLRRGKLDQWIERAHQMLADAVTEEEAELLLAAEKARNDAIAATKHKSPATATKAPAATQQQQYNFVRVSPNKAAVSKAKLQQQPQP